MEEAGQRTLLADLDERQDDVMKQLDRLNQDVESLIARWTTDRNSPPAEPAA